MRKISILLFISLSILTACASQEDALQIGLKNQTSAKNTNVQTETTASEEAVLEVENKDVSDLSGKNETSDDALDTEDNETAQTQVKVNSVTEITMDSSDIVSQVDSDELEENDDDIIRISEKMFVTHTNDIYINAPDYIGKTIEYEGFLLTYQENEQDQMKYFVVRNGPGCCGNDGIAGFEVVWDGDYPDENEWLKVRGKLEEYDDHGFTYLVVVLDTLEVMDVRGKDTVYQ